MAPVERSAVLYETVTGAANVVACFQAVAALPAEFVATTWNEYVVEAASPPTVYDVEPVPSEVISVACPFTNS
jgi:hypothetical protein